ASSGTNKVMTSPDGINWTAHASANDAAVWNSVTYGNGKFVAVASNGDAMSSSDGETWVYHDTGLDNAWNGVTYGNGKFVAVAISGTGNRVMTSEDGATWTSRITPADNF